MSKHTPGPWRRYQKNKVVAVVVDDGTDREVIHWSGFDSSDFKHADRANALLIAAAPELLSSLKRIMDGFDAGVWVRSTKDDDNPAWALNIISHVQALGAAISAIKKAEGAQ